MRVIVVRRIVVGLVVVVAMMMPTYAAAADGNNACSLATPAEIQTALSSPIVMNSMGNDLCMGATSNAKVMLRIATGLDPTRDRSGAKEKAGLDIVRKMGGQAEAKTFGPIVCSTIQPPPGKDQMGYNTTCTVSKDTAVAGIEVTAKSQKDMVPIDKLHPVAEKIAGRF
ncbi:MAG: hypothetical protein OJF51_002123 [Nitrospira sp.]|jgi:hypothetical protein|nr:MAG: hypothetical protein OJF51_002123 [Nitrospira sp.]